MSEKEDEILVKQLAMLRERHHADVEKVDAEKAAGIIADCGADILFISDDEELLSKAAHRNIATNSPAKMRQAYEQAMDMLKNLGLGSNKK